MKTLKLRTDHTIRTAQNAMFRLGGGSSSCFGKGLPVLRIAMVCAILLAFTLVALAQDTNAALTNAVPIVAATTAVNLDLVTLWNGLVVLVVPLVVLGSKKVLPVLPKITWPLLAVVLGVAADWFLSKYGALPHSSWALGALCGAAGIGLREATKQVLVVIGVGQEATPAVPAPTKPAGT